jgi:hypothetical protein
MNLATYQLQSIFDVLMNNEIGERRLPLSAGSLFTRMGFKMVDITNVVCLKCSGSNENNTLGFLSHVRLLFVTARIS